MNSRFDTKEEIIDKIKSAGYPDGSTETHIGIDYVRTNIFNPENDRPNVANVLIVITDGAPSDNVLTVAAAERAKQNMAIFAIGVGSVQLDLLRDISSPPQKLDQNYFRSVDFNSLSAVVEQVTTEACIIVNGEFMHQFVSKLSS